MLCVVSDMYGFAVASNADLPNLEGKVDELLAERLSDPSALRHFDDGKIVHYHHYHRCFFIIIIIIINCY